jgi:8-oxo-dGTP pyrophosphatase MutT (NUDIX family)
MDMSFLQRCGRNDDFNGFMRAKILPMDRPWKPNVTVAALMERDGAFLLVEEETGDGLRLNQPAGHLDPGESLLEACAREALEETAFQFAPTALVGIYQWPRPQGDITYLRFAFAGQVGERVAGRALDTGIVRALWLTAAEIEASQASHRSPLVWQCVQDFVAGRRYPLELIRHHG